MTILGVKRHVVEKDRTDPLAQEVHPSDDLISVLPRCDYVVVAVPLNDATRGLVGAKALSAVKTTAVIINVGRGPVIDEGALIRAPFGEENQGRSARRFRRRTPAWRTRLLSTRKRAAISPLCQITHLIGWTMQCVSLSLNLRDFAEESAWRT